MAAQNGLPEFEMARKRTRQQFTQAKQEASDAMRRRAAARGGLRSGAFEKQQQVVGTQLAEKQASAMQDVDFAEAAEQRRMGEIEKQRQFQSGEAEKQRSFTAGQAQEQRQFAMGEGQKQREFAAAESSLGRQQQAEQFGKSFDLQKEQADKNFDLTMRQFEQDKNVTGMNQLVQLKELGLDPDMNAIVIDVIRAKNMGGPLQENVKRGIELRGLQGSELFKGWFQ